MPQVINPAPEPGGFISGAADAYAAGLRMTQALRTAAQQQQQYQDQLQQRSFENKVQLMQQGGTPFEPYAAAPGTGPSTSSVPGKSLIPRNQAVEPPGKGQVVQEPISGHHYYMPTPAEKAKAKQLPLDETNSLVPAGELGKALQAAGLPPGQRIKPSDAHSIIEALNQAAGRSDTEIHYEKDDDGTLHVFATDKRGQSSKEIGTFKSTAKTKTEPADQTQIVPGIAGPGGAPVIVNRSEGTAKVVQLPAGVKPTLTENQERIRQEHQDRADALAEARQIRKEDRDREAAEKKAKNEEVVHERHDKLQKEEQTQWELQRRYYELAGSTADTVVDPRSNQEIPLTPARKQEYILQAQRAKKEAQALAESQKSIRRSMKWGEFSEAPPNPYLQQPGAPGGR